MAGEPACAETVGAAAVMAIITRSDDFKRTVLGRGIANLTVRAALSFGSCVDNGIPTRAFGLDVGSGGVGFGMVRRVCGTTLAAGNRWLQAV